MQLNRVFHPFSSSISNKGVESVVGLGLVIVRKIVEEHSGKVWVKSELGEGTTFYVSLPLK